MIVSGKFDVKILPLDSYLRNFEGMKLGRMSIEKIFFGELEGSSRGEMLNVVTEVDGSAGYVAIEHFEGVLSGKKGGFVLQHFGIMVGNGVRNEIRDVVPDSGYNELLGIRGSMKIRVEDSHHFYDFEFQLPD